MSGWVPNPTKEDLKKGAADIAANGKIRRSAPSKSEIASLPGVSIHDNPDGTWTARVSGQKAMKAAAEAFKPQMRLSTERGNELRERRDGGATFYAGDSEYVGLACGHRFLWFKAYDKPKEVACPACSKRVEVT